MDAMRMPLGRDFAYGCLRSLREDDVDDMLVWMHDPQTARHFARDFMSVTRDDAILFVRSSWNDASNVHLAVAAGDGSYLGTASLKNVDVSAMAEYAIAMTAAARGTGAALVGTRDLLRLAFDSLGLRNVWLCVKESNARANAFYAKVGFAAQDCRGDGTGLRYLEMSRAAYEEQRLGWTYAVWRG